MEAKLQEKVPAMTDDEKEVLTAAVSAAREILSVGVSLVTEAASVKAMTKALSEIPCVKSKGKPSTDGDYFIVSYMPRLAGEADTEPMFRQPPLRNNPNSVGGSHIRKMIQAAMHARCPSIDDGAVELMEGDVYILADSGSLFEDCA